MRHNWAGSEQGIAALPVPQPRTCPIKAYGSSGHRLAAGAIYRLNNARRRHLELLLRQRRQPRQQVAHRLQRGVGLPIRPPQPDDGGPAVGRRIQRHASDILGGNSTERHDYDGDNVLLDLNGGRTLTKNLSLRAITTCKYSRIQNASEPRIGACPTTKSSF